MLGTLYCKINVAIHILISFSIGIAIILEIHTILIVFVQDIDLIV